ncbi:MAG: N-acetyltransferase [Acidimicrobiales bacterium]
MLVETAVGLARDRSRRRVWCTTTNDDLAALGFWQSVGFRLVRLRPGALRDARRLKAGIPDRGWRGLPVRDEIDLERISPRPLRPPG